MSALKAALRRHWPYLALAGLIGLAYFPVFLGQIIFERDAAHWIFPARWLARHQLLTGQSLAWDPLQGLGFPTTADPLYGFCYPPNWLYLLPGTARLVTVDLLLHVAWGGAGVIFLAKRFGARPAASLIGGVAWSISGAVTSFLPTGVLTQASAWVPWIAHAGVILGRVASDATVDRRRLGRCTILAALPVAAALLQGEVFIATMATVVAVVLGFSGRDAVPTEARLSRGTFLVRFVASGLGAVLLAVALAAINLVPALVAQAGTHRSKALGLEESQVWSMHPLRLVEILAPGAPLGNPLIHYPGGDTVRDPIQGDTLMWGVYAGATAVFLAAFALRRGDRRSPTLWAIAIVAFLAATGRFVPVHRILRWLVPPLSYMRFPEKYWIVAELALATLAALGAERMLGGDPRSGRRAMVGVGVFGAAALAGIALPRSVGPMLLGPAIAGTILLLLVATLGWTARRWHLARGIFASILLAIVFTDLALHVMNLQTYVSPDLPYRKPPALDLISGKRSPAAAPPRVFVDRRARNAMSDVSPATTAAENESRSLITLATNASGTHGLATLPGYDAAIPESWIDLWSRAERRQLIRVLRFAGAEFAVMAALPGRAPLYPVGDEMSPVADLLPGARLYSIRRPLPRVFTTPTAVRSAVPISPYDLLSDDVLGGRAALVEEADLVLTGPPQEPGRCHTDGFESGRLLATCASDRPALAVFVEQWAPGWSATVDGQERPIHRVNQVMRGVRIGPGSHRIEMRYRAPALAPAAMISCGGLAFCLVLLVATRRPKTTG